MSRKERIIPQLDSNFHESIFFLEIQFKKTPTKEIKEKLINYYIKGVDYYTGINKRDFSLYFQTKLLNIMKDQDHFEKTIESKMPEIDHSAKIKAIMNKYKDMDDIQNNTLNDEIQKQREKFLFNLAFKKKYRRLKRFNSLTVTSDTKNKLAFKLRKDSLTIAKKSSIDLTTYNNQLIKINKINNNSLFGKIDNTLTDFNKINTHLIIEYAKKLKQYAKLKMEQMDKKTDKYLGYIQTNNELNLLYDDLPDKNGEDAKNIKNQIKSNSEEWELYVKNENENEKDIIKENNLKNKINVNNISNIDNVLNNSLKKMKELIKEN
jgi:hypothetical protein